jgi:protein arginine kinase activator
MQCQNCKERPAAIHLTQIENNSVTSLHLCEQCAHDKGIETQASLNKLPITDFLASMAKGAMGHLPPGEGSGECSACGASLNDFRETGRLGCPECYQSFRAQLKGLLRRLHGSSQHVGDAYVWSNDIDQPSLGDLREKLRQAIHSEQFELAAELRDRIRIMER